MVNDAERIIHELLEERLNRNVNNSMLLVCKHCEAGGACCYQLLKGTEWPSNNLYAQVLMCLNSVGVSLDGVYDFYVDTIIFCDLLFSNWIGTLLTNQGEYCDYTQVFDQMKEMWGEAFSLLKQKYELIITANFHLKSV